MKSLVLASTSPRRRQILEQAGYVFSTSSVKVSEIPQENLNLYEQIQEVAERKALALLHSDKSLKAQDNIILGADTVVVLDGLVLGKPQDEGQCQEYLDRLSGQMHLVITGVSLVESVSERVINFYDETRVYFKKLQKEQMKSYARSGDGLDKAGGYGIQGSAREFVEKIEGSFLNVVGLPLEKLQKVFEENDWKFDSRKI